MDPSSSIFPEPSSRISRPPGARELQKKFKGELTEAQLDKVLSTLCRDPRLQGVQGIAQARLAVRALNDNETSLALEALFLAIHTSGCPPLTAGKIYRNVKNVFDRMVLPETRLISPEELKGRILESIKDPAHAKAIQQSYDKALAQLEKKPEQALFLLQIYQHYGQEGFQRLSATEKTALLEGKPLTLEQQHRIVKQCNLHLIDALRAHYPKEIFEKALRGLPEGVLEGKKVFLKADQMALVVTANKLFLEDKGIPWKAVEELPDAFRREALSKGEGVPTEDEVRELREISLELQAATRISNHQLIDQLKGIYLLAVFNRAMKELPEGVIEGKETFSQEVLHAFIAQANQGYLESKGLSKSTLQTFFPSDECEEFLTGKKALSQRNMKDLLSNIEVVLGTNEKVEQKLEVTGLALSELFSPDEQQQIARGEISLLALPYSKRVTQAAFHQQVNDPEPFTPERIYQLKALFDLFPQEALSEDFARLTRMLHGSLLALSMSLEPTTPRRDILSPKATGGGISGSYFLPGFEGKPERWNRSPGGLPFYAIFKPSLEDAFGPENDRTSKDVKSLRAPLGSRLLRRGHPSGEASKKEHMAYLLDHDHFAGVPLTVMVDLPSHPKFARAAAPSKVGSLQEFQQGAEEVHALTTVEDFDKILIEAQVRRLAILDIRLGNSDRHFGNLLVLPADPNGLRQLVPIDHGLVLPDTLDEAHFEWTAFLASRTPFNTEELAYIAHLDVDKDIKILEAQGIREACFAPFIARTLLLKRGAAAGLTPHHLAYLMGKQRGKVCRFSDAFFRASKGASSWDEIKDRLDREFDNLFTLFKKP